MAGRLFLGTSGYSYPEWKGTFYPEDSKNEDFLRFYASRFSTVEINQTFYRFPSARVLEPWLEETPEDFCFSVKANRRITHVSRLKEVAQITRDFVDRCELLGSRLGPMLFQLPPQFVRNDDRLDAFLAALPAGHRYTMEFRHKSWLDDGVFGKLREAGVSLCISGEGKLSVPREVTADHAYVRLRQQEYQDHELEDWKRWIDGQLEAGIDAYVYLKHDEGGESPETILDRLRS